LIGWDLDIVTSTQVTLSRGGEVLTAPTRSDYLILDPPHVPLSHWRDADHYWAEAAIGIDHVLILQLAMSLRVLVDHI
jgi:hypothetical protein